eukprot:scaffold199750_cov19-Prasinocladus_malaysianus.AAC.1
MSKGALCLLLPLEARLCTHYKCFVIPQDGAELRLINVTQIFMSGDFSASLWAFSYRVQNYSNSCRCVDVNIVLTRRKMDASVKLSYVTLCSTNKFTLNEQFFYASCEFLAGLHPALTLWLLSMLVWTFPAPYNSFDPLDLTYACQDLREVLTIGEAMNVELAQMDQLRK